MFLLVLLLLMMVRKMKKILRFVLGASWQRGRVLWVAPWEQPSPPLKTMLMMKIILLQIFFSKFLSKFCMNETI